MSAPRPPQHGSRAAAGRREPRAVDRWAGLVEGWLRRHTILVYAFLYLPIVVVVLFAFNDTDRRRHDWGGLLDRSGSRSRSTTRSCIEALRNSFIVAVPNAILATLFGTMAALGLQRVGRKTPPRLRRADLHQHHRPGDRHRPRDPRAVRHRLRRHRGHRSASSSTSGTRRSSRPTCCSTRASCCSWSGRGCRAWTGRWSRRARTCSRRRGGRSARSPSRSCCRRSSRASCSRSRSASTTTSSRRS